MKDFFPNKLICSSITGSLDMCILKSFKRIIRQDLVGN